VVVEVPGTQVVEEVVGLLQQVSSGIIHTQGYKSGDGQVIFSWTIMACASLRSSITVTVASPVNPANVTSSPSSIVCGNNSTLNATSGSVITWWDAPTGGNIIGTGNGL